MTDMNGPNAAVLDQERLTIDDLFVDLTRQEADVVVRRASALPTDVMLSEGAATLVDAAAYLRVVAREQAVPGGAAASRMMQLADELTVQAAGWHCASDRAAISIRAVDRPRPPAA